LQTTPFLLFHIISPSCIHVCTVIYSIKYLVVEEYLEELTKGDNHDMIDSNGISWNMEPK